MRLFNFVKTILLFLKSRHSFCLYITLFGVLAINTSLYSQTCIDIPELNGPPVTNSTPAGWSIWYKTPDVITGNGVYPTTVSANIMDVNGYSQSGGEMIFFIINATNGFQTESIKTNLTGLLPGVQYAISFEWQQATLDYTITTNDFSGGKLGIYLDGIHKSTFSSTGGINDTWQTATFTFTATSTSHVLALKGELLSGSSRGAIVIDDLPCSITTLPVELTNFNVELIDNIPKITWKTLSENNNDYFIIEKSIDGVIWTQISEIQGKGTTSEEVFYSYTDKQNNSAQTIYYRLKQVDYNGVSTIYDPVSVYFEDNSFSIFPNPAQNIIQIKGVNSNLVQLYDCFGNLIEIEPLLIKNLNNQFSLDISDFKNGLYIIRTSTESYKFYKN